MRHLLGHQPVWNRLQLLHLDHPYSSIAVLTDDIQSDKLSHVLPAARRGDGDATRVAAVTEWMRRRELSIYAAADATVTVSTHDARPHVTRHA